EIVRRLVHRGNRYCGNQASDQNRRYASQKRRWTQCSILHGFLPLKATVKHRRAQRWFYPKAINTTKIVRLTHVKAPAVVRRAYLHCAYSTTACLLVILEYKSPCQITGWLASEVARQANRGLKSAMSGWGAATPPDPAWRRVTEACVSLVNRRQFGGYVSTTGAYHGELLATLRRDTRGGARASGAWLDVRTASAVFRGTSPAASYPRHAGTDARGPVRRLHRDPAPSRW